MPTVSKRLNHYEDILSTLDSLPKSISKTDTTSRWWNIRENIRDGNVAVNTLMDAIVEQSN